uniref:Uncharacterized protein n=1 Tax=Arundo donax TaxID=35708 RepID=A0A0A9DCM8_ARUDO
MPFSIWLLCWDSFCHPCGLCLSKISECQCQPSIHGVLSRFRSMAMASFG